MRTTVSPLSSMQVSPPISFSRLFSGRNLQTTLIVVSVLIAVNYKASPIIQALESPLTKENRSDHYGSLSARVVSSPEGKREDW
jgi:hypothetical protein